MARRFFKTGADFRRWLETHHADTSELLLGFYKLSSGKGGITYKQALDEALCSGWIDGVRRSVDAQCYEQRFTPRSARSHWSRVNLARFEELKALGLVTPAGLSAHDRRNTAPKAGYSHEAKDVALSPDMVAALHANKKAGAFYDALRPGYRRQLTFWIMSAKRDETRQSRFVVLLREMRLGRRIDLLKGPPRATR